MGGYLITFEGIDGAGKTTVIDGIARRMEADNISFIRVRTPGGSPIGQRIRDLVLNPEYDVDPIAKFRMFVADYIHLYRQVIAPALQQNGIVLCDRYKDSAMVYQIMTGDYWPNNESRTQASSFLHRMLPDPDMTFILNLPVEEAIARSGPRRGKGEDAFKQADPIMWDRRRKAYYDIYRANTMRHMCMINTSRKHQETVTDEIYRWINLVIRP